MVRICKTDYHKSIPDTMAPTYIVTSPTTIYNPLNSIRKRSKSTLSIAATFTGQHLRISPILESPRASRIAIEQRPTVALNRSHGLLRTNGRASVFPIQPGDSLSLPVFRSSAIDRLIVITGSTWIEGKALVDVFPAHLGNSDRLMHANDTLRRWYLFTWVFLRGSQEKLAYVRRVPFSGRKTFGYLSPICSASTFCGDKFGILGGKFVIP